MDEINEETIQAFSIMLKALEKDRKVYNYRPRHGKRNSTNFTVLGLADLAGNHLFDDNPILFGITPRQGNLIRDYFGNNTIEKCMNDLYRIHVFSGETKGFMDESLLEDYVLLNDSEV